MRAYKCVHLPRNLSPTYKSLHYHGETGNSCEARSLALGAVALGELAICSVLMGATVSRNLPTRVRQGLIFFLRRRCMSAKLPCGEGIPVPWNSLPASISAVPPFLRFHQEGGHAKCTYMRFKSTPGYVSLMLEHPETSWNTRLSVVIL